jgi:hypothetical protein
MQSVFEARHGSENFGFYLAGLFEGDGHITKTGFHITFHINQLPLVKKIISKLGYGTIRYKKSDNTCVLNITNLAKLISFISLINGKLRTPKISRLYSLIDYVNGNSKTSIGIRAYVKIPKLPLSSEPILSNAWLSGFIDADGSFDIRHTKKTVLTKKRIISCRFRLEQRMLDPKTGDSYKEVLDLIASNLAVKLNTREQKNTGGRIYYIIAMSSLASINILRSYLDTNTLI